LKQNSENPAIDTSYGADSIPFGFGKIKILEVLGNLLKSKS
jgi:hypothetical protein